MKLQLNESQWLDYDFTPRNGCSIRLFIFLMSEKFQVVNAYYCCTALCKVKVLLRHSSE